MISIIYVYYNSADVIISSIKSVLKSKTKIDFEIIIVVNKCTDINLKQIEDISSKIKIIKLDKNNGFGKANNIGVKNANGKYILILNPDTLLQPNVLDRMFLEMETNGEVGASVCKLVDENNKLQETVIRKNYNFTYILIQLFFLEKTPIYKHIFKKYYYSKEDYLVEQYPDAISGAFMFIRKEIFLKVDGFDEQFFMYVEDIDLSKRIKNISKLHYLPSVEVKHIGDTALANEYILDKIIMNYTSLFYFIQKNYGKNTLFLFKILIFINGLLFIPFVKIIKKEKTRSLILNRSKFFIKIFSRKIENA